MADWCQPPPIKKSSWIRLWKCVGLRPTRTENSRRTREKPLVPRVPLMWKAKATSKTQQLKLIYKEFNIFFISHWTLLVKVQKSLLWVRTLLHFYHFLFLNWRKLDTWTLEETPSGVIKNPGFPILFMRLINGLLASIACGVSGTMFFKGRQ